MKTRMLVHGKATIPKVASAKIARREKVAIAIRQWAKAHVVAG
jgi:hypothetical protein